MEHLGTLADEVMATPVQSGPVCNVTYANHGEEHGDLEEAMVYKVGHQQRQFQQPQQRQQRFPAPPRDDTRGQQAAGGRICRFHRRFGARARNCSPPCYFRRQESVAASQYGWSGNGTAPPRHQ
jgi:hypothetical protein